MQRFILCLLSSVLCPLALAQNTGTGPLVIRTSGAGKGDAMFDVNFGAGRTLKVYAGGFFYWATDAAFAGDAAAFRTAVGLGTLATQNGTFSGTSSGTNTGDQTTVTGNAGTATALATARAIYGNNFDGTAALTQIIASTYGGTGNGFAKFSGPASAEKTFTLPNASAAILTDNAAVTVAQGGTGRATGTTAYSLVATGTTATGAQQTLANGAATELLVGGGAGALPVWTGATGSGAPVRANSPSLVTPSLGAATASSLDVSTVFRLQLRAGTDNLFFTAASGESLASGADSNVGIGFQVLSSLTTGDYNIAIGSQTLKALATGSSNTAVGYVAGSDVSFSGSRNSLFGTATGFGLTTGTDNVFLGYNTGGSVTTGSGNTIIGSAAVGSAGLANNIILASGTSGTTRAQFDGTNWLFTGKVAADNIRYGAGSPESAVTAAVGTLYLRTDGGAGTTLYVKESGSGNTGWAPK